MYARLTSLKNASGAPRSCCIIELCACSQPLPLCTHSVPRVHVYTRLPAMANVDEIRTRVGLEEFAVTNVSSSHEAKLMRSLPHLTSPSLLLPCLLHCTGSRH